MEIRRQSDVKTGSKGSQFIRHALYPATTDVLKRREQSRKSRIAYEEQSSRASDKRLS